MDGDGGSAQTERDFRDLIEHFRRAAEEARSSEILIASAEYELALLKEAVRAARLR